MARETDIQWCDSTVNPTNFACDGCELWTKTEKRCYAGRWAERVSGKGAFDEPIELRPGRMADAAKWPDLRGQVRHGKPWIPKELPRLIFIGDMADTLSAGVPFHYLKSEIIDVVAKWPHIGLWLTKRPSRLAEFTEWLKQKGVEWPDNLWTGTSITSRKTLPRINHLLACGNLDTKHFLSIEPLWESLYQCSVEEPFGKGLEKWLTPVGYYDSGEGDATPEQDTSDIDWVIVGGESGPDAKPCHVEWIDEIVHLCSNAFLGNHIENDPVPCFVKQLGSLCLTHNANTMDWPDHVQLEGHGEGAAAARAIFTDKKGGAFHEFPDQLHVRQFPKLQP